MPIPEPFILSTVLNPDNLVAEAESETALVRLHNLSGGGVERQSAGIAVFGRTTVMSFFSVTAAPISGANFSVMATDEIL